MAYLLPASKIMVLSGEVSDKKYPWGRIEFRKIGLLISFKDDSPQPPSSNARLLVSRNKREGLYCGRFSGDKAGKSKPEFIRTWNSRYSLHPRKVHIMLREL